MKPNETIFKSALQEAQKAFQKDEVPVSAVIFHTQTLKIIAKASNTTKKQNNALLHAEINAITKALKKLKQKRLDGYSIFVSLEPCPMCAAALALSHIDAVYFGAFDKKSGGICQGPQIYTHPQIHHKPLVEGGFLEQQFGALLTDFFKQKRSR